MEPERTDVAKERRRIDRQLWAFGFLFLLALAAYNYSRGWATQERRLSDGRSIQVLNWDSHLSIVVYPSSAQPRTDNYFWVRYYASSRRGDSMLAEARGIAPLLFPVADSLGFMTMQLDPCYPIGSRLFPIAVISWHLRYKRDSTGHWKEAGT